MNVHEYQGKELLARYGVAVPTGKVAASAQEAREAATALGSEVLVVKAQIHAGGRGAGARREAHAHVHALLRLGPRPRRPSWQGAPRKGLLSDPRQVAPGPPRGEVIIEGVVVVDGGGC